MGMNKSKNELNARNSSLARFTQLVLEFVVCVVRWQAASIGKLHVRVFAYSVCVGLLCVCSRLQLRNGERKNKHAGCWRFYVPNGFFRAISSFVLSRGVCIGDGRLTARGSTITDNNTAHPILFLVFIICSTVNIFSLALSSLHKSNRFRNETHILFLLDLSAP